MKVLLILLTFVIVGCNQNMRVSICDRYLDNFPSELVGTYKMNIQNIFSPEFNSGNKEENLIYLTEFSVLTSSLGSLGAAGAGQSNLCKLGDSLLIEYVSDAGLYSYSRVSATAEGLYLSPLVFKVSDALKPVSTPQVKVWEDGKWVDNTVLISNDNYVIDNSNITSTDVLSELEASSVSIFLEKIKSETPLKSNLKVLKKL